MVMVVGGSSRFLSVFVPVVVVCLLALSESAHAWGPLSHATFNCLGIHPELSVAQCLQEPSQAAFVVGSDMPDAFGFGNFNITSPGVVNLCQGLTYVHDPFFGGEMILLALKKAGGKRSAADGFDYVGFSTAFVSHIIGDLVGFNGKGGVLCTKQANRCDSLGILYIPEWGYMGALDAYFYAEHNLTASELPVPSADTLGTLAYQFVAEASEHYNKIDPSFAPVTPAEVEQCANYWSGNMRYVYERAAFYASTPERQQFLHEEISWFAPRATAGPSAPARDWPTMAKWLEGQTHCASSAIKNYMSLLLDQKVGPKDAFLKTNEFVLNLYSQGACGTPSSQSK